MSRDFDRWFFEQGGAEELEELVEAGTPKDRADKESLESYIAARMEAADAALDNLRSAP